MKIAIINSVCGKGSTGKICVELAKVFQEAGHNCRVFYGRGLYQDDSVDTFRIGNNLSVAKHIVLSRLFDMHGLASSIATQRLIDELSDFKPDIINLHNIHGYYLNYEALLKYIAEHHIKTVWTLHDCWPITGHCSYLNSLKCEKYKTECRNCPGKGGYPSSFILDRSYLHFMKKKYLYKKIDKLRIIVPSEWLKEIIDESILGNFPIDVIHNGIDTSVFKGSYPKEQVISTYEKYFGIKNDKKIVLGVANIWSKRKGLDDIIRISEMIDDEYIVCLVGLSKRQLLKIPRSVKGIIRTDNQVDLAKIYQGAYVYVNPTYNDNYPTTNIEAAACGTRVITYKTGGSPESIKDRRNIIPCGDIQAFLDAIKSPFDAGVRCEIDAKKCYRQYVSIIEQF